MKTQKEIESYILGCMGISNSLYREGIKNIEPDYFTVSDNKKLFALMKEFDASPFNLSGFLIFLGDKNEDRRWMDILMKATEIPGSTSSFNQAVHQLIREKGIREKHRAIEKFKGKLNSGEDAEAELIKDLQEIDKKFYYKSLEDFNLDDVLVKTGREEGIGLGIEGLESITNRPGTVTVVAARTSEGKTTFMLNSMVNLMMKHEDKTFIFYTYEEERKYLFVKIFMIYLGLTDNTNYIFNCNNPFREALIFLLHKEGNPRAMEAYNYFKEAEIKKRFVIISKRYNEVELGRSIENWSGQQDVGCVYIDYIQKIPSSGGGNRLEEMQKVSAGILNSSMEAGVPIVVGAQFNREATKSTPNLGMIRECGDIEQDANSVLCLQKVGESQMAINVLKAREGMRSSNQAVGFRFDGRRLLIQKDWE